MSFELSTPTETLLWEIQDKWFKRNNIAKTYALTLKSSVPVDWRKVNQTIVDRWSRSGLEYIKKKAWKIIEGKEVKL